MAAGYTRTLGSFYGIMEVTKFMLPNATLANGDIVIMKASGLVAAAAGERPLGVIMQSATASTTTPAVVNVTPGLRVIMDSSSTGVVSTDPGKFFDLTGGTGAQAIDITTRDTTYTTSGAKVFYCENVNVNTSPSTVFDASLGSTFGIYVLRTREI